MRTSEVLNKAADLIEERGWATGSGWDDHPGKGVCMEGGILAALGLKFADVDLQEFWTCPAYRAVADYLSLDQTPERSLFTGCEKPRQPLYTWNDRQKDAGPVIEVLRATAVIEAARESDMADDLIALMASPA